MVKKVLRKFNYEIVRIKHNTSLPNDFEEFHSEIFKKVAPYTMTSPERIYSLIETIKYIERNKIEGDIVECGVWKGGSMMAVAETLKEQKSFSRQLYLYDTFEGMSEPTQADKTYTGEDAAHLLQKDKNKETNPVWAYSTLREVREAINATGYPEDKIQYIVGKVEETIPANIPSKISVLRLDTDWYESTRHELIHLYPLLSLGGVVIIDDYGYWQGARKAVDEYFGRNNIRILLNRIDETGRIAIKQEQ